jgi:hypothetical protein
MPRPADVIGATFRLRLSCASTFLCAAKTEVKRFLPALLLLISVAGPTHAQDAQVTCSFVAGQQRCHTLNQWVGIIGSLKVIPMRQSR